MRLNYIALALFVLLMGCVDDSEQANLGLANVTDMAELPQAINNESGGWFGLGILMVVFVVNMVTLSAMNLKTNAMLASLFSAFVFSGMLVALNALTPVAPVAILALLGGLLLYDHFR